MKDRELTKNLNFDISDNTVHELASAILLSRYDSEFVLTQGNYAYKVRGGDDGYLYYKKGNSDKWVLIVNWCFYGLYIVVRNRKPVWLRPMYKNLFARMNFISITFQDDSFELVGSDGRILRGKRFHLSHPSAFNEVMVRKFSYSREESESLKVKIGFA